MVEIIVQKLTEEEKEETLKEINEIILLIAREQLAKRA